MLLPAPTLALPRQYATIGLSSSPATAPLPCRYAATAKLNHAYSTDTPSLLRHFLMHLLHLDLAIAPPCFHARAYHTVNPFVLCRYAAIVTVCSLCPAGTSRLRCHCITVSSCLAPPLFRGRGAAEFSGRCLACTAFVCRHCRARFSCLCKEFTLHHCPVFTPFSLRC